MINSLLIANRGEIAVRIIRTCRILGIRTVLACSEADRNSLATELADQVVCVGPAAAARSYLDQSALISAAILTHCDAIHPGVGFLSENCVFAEKVESEGLVFIGPPPVTLEILGDKIQSKKTAHSQGLPLIPGTEGKLDTVNDAINVAEHIGYPVLLKASAGGGGKGMRVVQNSHEMQEVYAIASTEAMQSFGDGSLYLEQYFENPSHVEVQLIADSQGNVVHLGVRDCTVQFKHQKLIEESPSPNMTEKQAELMCADAARLFSSLDYTGPGTVEFLFDGEHYYFMEVNARVQVEHPVSEVRSNVDIVCEQIRTCSGEPLSLNQDSIAFRGHAMECRINARTAGTVRRYRQPGGYGVRVDSMLFSGCVVPPYYDSLLAKIIVHASNRKQCITAMLAALDELIIEGIETNIDEQRTILRHKVFRSGNYGTTAYDVIFNE